MRILVTGGAGFIGSNVAHLLCEEGHTVTVLDNLSSGYAELLDMRCRFIHSDLCDADALQNAIAGVDAVVHLAARSIIAGSFEDPLGYVHTNVLSGTLLLEAMRAHGVKHIVFSSSASVYGEPVNIPVREDDPKFPLHIYGATKLAFESILLGYYSAFGINSVSLRYFNAYGPGDLQEPVTRAVPRWIRAALTGKPVTVYWKGNQYRDYVFVEDIARAHVQVLGLPGVHIFNIGSSSGVLMTDVLHLIENITGKTLDVIDGGERAGDPMRLVADTSRIEREIGWQCRVNLKEGLQQAVQFYEQTRSLWDRHELVTDL